jgi:molybdopterin-binding protein
MSVVKELIRSEQDGTLSFGDYTLGTKSKLSDFEHCGDLYKVKTFYEITKLEKNGSFVYESVPGTAVNGFKATDGGVSFLVEGKENAQITLELEEGHEYEITVDGESSGKMATNMGGKLVLSVEFDEGKEVAVSVTKAN